MAECFSANVIKALDICAPLKTIRDHSQYKFGLSENTKALISECFWVTNIKEVQNGPKGQMEEMGTIPAEINRLFASEVLNHEVPNFPSIFGHTHSEVGWPYLQFY